jgi:hypothetical protein
MGKGFNVVVVREYDPKRDLTSVEELEESCEVGSLLVDLMGDPLARIRQSPSFHMLVRICDYLYVYVKNGFDSSFWPMHVTGGRDR